MTSLMPLDKHSLRYIKTNFTGSSSSQNMTFLCQHETSQTTSLHLPNVKNHYFFRIERVFKHEK